MRPILSHTKLTTEMLAIASSGTDRLFSLAGISVDSRACVDGVLNKRVRMNTTSII